MRSSKNRSRSKSNRQRSIGNIINRVFDSSGPEGKVRGTPQQIIDKYLMLARDAQLSNDRVAEQNFLQHAEHYTRMLGEAQAELAREQATRQPQGGGERPQHQNGGRDRDDDQPSLGGGAFDVEDAGLVETPEMRVQNDQRREPRRDNQQGGNRNDGQRNDSQRNDGQRNDGQRNDGQRNDGQRNDGNRAENYRDRNQSQNRNESPRAEPPREPRPPRDEPRRDSAASVPVAAPEEDIPLPSFVAEPLRTVEPAATEAASKPKPRRRSKPATEADANPADGSGTAAAE